MSEILEDEDDTGEILEKSGKKSRGQCNFKTLDQFDEEQEYFPTGIGEIDSSVGGFPKGAIIQVAGPPGVGKTTIIIQGVIFALSRIEEKYKAAFVDFECRMQRRILRYFCKLYSVNESRVLFGRPENGEQGGESVSCYVDDPLVPIIVVDSLKAIIPKECIEKSIDENESQRNQARLIDRILKSILHRVSENGKTVICIDHLKEKGKVMGKYPIMETASGESIRFFSSARWFILPRKKIKKTEGGITRDLGRVLLITIPKSTVSPSAAIEGMTFYFCRGISSYKWYLAKARDMGLLHIDKVGSSKTYRIGKGEKSKVVANNKKEMIKWICTPGNKLWGKLIDFIIDKEKKEYSTKQKSDPEIFGMEFDE